MPGAGRSVPRPLGWFGWSSVEPRAPRRGHAAGRRSPTSRRLTRTRRRPRRNQPTPEASPRRRQPDRANHKPGFQPRSIAARNLSGAGRRRTVSKPSTAACCGTSTRPAQPDQSPRPTDEATSQPHQHQPCTEATPTGYRYKSLCLRGWRERPVCKTRCVRGHLVCGGNLRSARAGAA